MVGVRRERDVVNPAGRFGAGREELRDRDLRIDALDGFVALVDLL